MTARPITLAVLVVAMFAFSAAAGQDEPPPVNASPEPLDDPGLPFPDGLADALVPAVALPLLGVVAVAALFVPAERLGAWLLMRTGKLDAGDVLRHPTRRQIYESLLENPGAHFRELQRTLGLSNATILWHLDKLEAVGLVRSKRMPGKRLYYINGGQGELQPAVLAALLRNENVRRILLHLRRHPATTQTRLARELGLNQMTVRWHVNKLLREGFLAEEPNGRGAPLRIHPEHAGMVLGALAAGPPAVAPAAA